MASIAVDVMKICSRSRCVTLRALMLQSTQAIELQCHPQIDRCSRCWMSYFCQKTVNHQLPVSDPLLFTLPRTLRTLASVLQQTCKKKYDHSGTECCTDEWAIWPIFKSRTFI